jgi:hypothetical protein
MDTSRLRRFLDAEALHAGAQDGASPPQDTPLSVQEASADTSLFMLGAAPEVQEILVKIDVAGWNVDAEDVAVLKAALAAPLLVSAQMISVETVHATKGDVPPAPTRPGYDATRTLPEASGDPTTVFGSGVATEASSPTTAAWTPGHAGTSSGGEGAAPDFHVLLAGGLALAACLVFTCCALCAYQRRVEGQPGSKHGCGNSADAAENGAMRSVVEAPPDRIFARKASARGLPSKPSLASTSFSGRRTPNIKARVLEMGAFDRSMSRAAINPFSSETVAATGVGPPGARTYHSKVQTNEITPAEVPNPFLVGGHPEPPIRPSLDRPKSPVPASRGLAAEDGQHDMSNRACMYDEMSRREEPNERA